MFPNKPQNNLIWILYPFNWTVRFISNLKMLWNFMKLFNGSTLSVLFLWLLFITTWFEHNTPQFYNARKNEIMWKFFIRYCNHNDDCLGLKKYSNCKQQGSHSNIPMVLKFIINWEYQINRLKSIKVSVLKSKLINFNETDQTTIQWSLLFLFFIRVYNIK